MVWHLYIGWKMRSLEPPEVLTQIYQNSVKKFDPPEWPLLEVRRFFQWIQEMSLGILRRFQEKKVHYFFRVCNFGPTFGRLLHEKGSVRDSSHELWGTFTKYWPLLHRAVSPSLLLFIPHYTQCIQSHLVLSHWPRLWFHILMIQFYLWWHTVWRRSEIQDYASKFLFISVLEAEAPRARGHSGHEAPPMTHSLFTDTTPLTTTLWE